MKTSMPSKQSLTRGNIEKRVRARSIWQALLQCLTVCLEACILCYQNYILMVN